MTELLVYHHIPKTAGRSLRAVVRANYPGEQLVETYGGPFSPEWYRLWWGSLNASQRDRVRCVAGHTANGLIPVLDRPYRAFCVLRHPVERVLSLHRFLIHHIEANHRRMPGGAVRGSWSTGGVLARTRWSTEQVYEELGSGGRDDSEDHRVMAPFFDGQARVLAAAYPGLGPGPSYAPRPHGADSALLIALLERLERDYVVGVQEHLAESVGHFARTFGWSHRFLPRTNVAPVRRRAEELSNRAREAILAHNALDLALYEHFAERARARRGSPGPLRARWWSPGRDRASAGASPPGRSRSTPR